MPPPPLPVAQKDLPEYNYTHFHPSDTSGVLLSLDTTFAPPGVEPALWWPPAEKDWLKHARSDVTNGLAGVEIQAEDPDKAAAHWSRLLNRPVKATDTTPSTVTYTYDTAVEPRGLATSTTDSVAGTFRATYDADGSVATEKLPGGYTLTTTEDSVWYATVANTACQVIGGALQAGGITGLPPFSTDKLVCEFAESQEVVADPTLDGAGDWRRPQIFQYHVATRSVTERTPLADPLIEQAGGLRGAGAVGDLVLVGGPVKGPEAAGTIREDTGYSGLWMLDALQDAGYQNLKYKTVTVLSDPSANVDAKLASDLVDVYQQRTRDVFRVPYDPALVAGSVVPYAQLSANTRRQWLKACAGMAAAL